MIIRLTVSSSEYFYRLNHCIYFKDKLRHFVDDEDFKRWSIGRCFLSDKTMATRSMLEPKIHSLTLHFQLSRKARILFITSTVKFSLPLSSCHNRKPSLCVLCVQPPVVWSERPLVDSPWDLEEGFDWMHLSQRGVSICQLDGGDAERPHVTAGIVGVVILLFTGYDLARQHHCDHLNNSFKLLVSPKKLFPFKFLK